jgi:tetratricopeptide (TPR) repeat protein
MRIVVPLLFLIFAAPVSAPSASSQESKVPAGPPSALGPDVTKKVLTLIAQFGQPGELSGDMANVLELNQDQAAWPYQQLISFQDPSNPSNPIHMIASNTGNDPDLFLFVMNNGIRHWIHIRPDGKVVVGVALDKANNWSKMIPSDTQPEANSEMQFWNRNGEQAANWSVCQGEVRGSHPVTKEVKIAGCTWLINLPGAPAREISMAYTNRGMAYGADDQVKSLQDLTQAVKIDPSSASGWSQLCSAQTWSANDAESATRSCTKALENDPKSIEAWTFRGDIFLRGKEFDKAIADYDHAVELSSGQWMWPLDNRGEAYLRKGQLDLALADFNSVIRVSSDWAMGYLDRGILHLRTKAFDDAFADFRTGIKVDPKCGSCYIGQGLAKRAEGDTIGGDADIAKGKQMSPKATDNFTDDGITVP